MPEVLDYWSEFTFFFIQIITGIMLAMYYFTDSNLAFDSVMHLMRDVKNG